MKPFKVITYDVEHGSSHLIITPNEEHILIDAGSKADFSPALHLSESIENLRWFTLTHYDSDHLQDVENLFKLVKPKTLDRQKMTRAELSEYYEEITSYQEKFFEYSAEYFVPAPPINSPEYNWGGAQFYVFSNDKEDFESKNMNNLSIVTFVDYCGWTFLFPGDLEQAGWLKLLENEEFTKLLMRTDILIASHHGRDSGYCEEIFEYFEPQLVIISDKSSSETSVTDKYIAKSRGLNVIGHDGNKTKRYVLTTRNDGAIKFEINSEGNYEVKLFKTS